MSFFSVPQSANSNSNSGGAASVFGSANTTATNTTSNTANPTPSLFGNFGAPKPIGGATTSTFGGSTFGGGSTSNQTGGNLFGGNNALSASPAPSGGGLFGTNGAASGNPPATGGSFFGDAANNAAKPPGGGLFGGANASNPTSTASTSGNIFGGIGTSTTMPAAGTGGNLFGGGASSSGPTTGNLFGGNNPSSMSNNAGAAPATTNTLLGGSSAPFVLPKPGDTGASKPPGSGLFGLANAAASAASTSAPATGSTSTLAPSSTVPGSGLFNLPPKPATNPTTTKTTTPNPFGGGLFGKAESSTTQPVGGSSSSTTTPAAGGLFGNLSTNKDGDKKDAAPAAASGLGGLFGAKPAEKKDEASGSKDPSGPGPATTSTSVAFPPPSMLRGKSIEEIVNRWTSELDANVRQFNKFAAEVSVWDRALIENGNNIASLHSHVQAAERQQNTINESLEHIEQQQRDLSSTLDAYERASQELLGGQGGSLRTLDTGPADNERDKNYMLATDLNTQLDDLSGSLTQMIDSVNALSTASKPSDSADDPMSQIAQILSSHLESLQWIDGAVREVESKTGDVEKRIKESGHNLSGAGSKSRGFGMSR